MFSWSAQASGTIFGLGRMAVDSVINQLESIYGTAAYCVVKGKDALAVSVLAPAPEL
jgi:hypothetical protein